MNGRPLAFALLLLFAATAAAPAPLPAFTATGTRNVNGTGPDGKTGSAQVDVQVLHRGTVTRIDFLKFNVTTNQPDNAAGMVSMVPKGTISVLIDTGKSTLTLWSSATKTYYQTKLSTPASLMKTQKAPRTGGPFAQIGSALRTMTQYDVFSSSMTLTGDQKVNGHMAHVYHLTTTMQKHTDAGPSQTNADFALADDLSGIPVEMNVTFASAAKANASMKADLTQVSLIAPNPALLKPPPGYKRTTNPIIVIMGRQSGL